jgi:primosomal protein N' (replication factor Y) (superfamily II helicase)
MPDSFEYCDAALPVPLDRLFTYKIPLTLRHRVKIGCRVAAPLGTRKLTGVVVAVHDKQPAVATREITGLQDEEPVLDDELISLAKWIAEYYCAPIGEVLKGMLPLKGETRRSCKYDLTETGRAIARQLTASNKSDPALQILSILEQSPRSLEYLAKKVERAKSIVSSLVKRKWVLIDDQEIDRDPLRARKERLAIAFSVRPDAEVILKKSQRELLAFLELHPGTHNLAQLAQHFKRASEDARMLARKNLVQLDIEGLQPLPGYFRPPPVLNAYQQSACDEIERALRAGDFRSFLLQGVTGSGKTEVYLRSIEHTLSLDRNALLLVPEIALTPAMAGQFFHRFGKQVAILHSAFGDTERADQWRRIRNGQARVVIGTRSGVFAPVPRLGLIVVDEEHDGSYKQQETPRYNGRDVALVRAKRAGAVTILGSATPSVETRHNADRDKYQLLLLPERIASRPLPTVDVIDMRLEFLETKTQSTFSRRLVDEMTSRLEHGEQVMLLMNRRGFSSCLVCRNCGERLLCSNCSVVLTHHRKDRRMLCHYCGYAEKIPTACPHCGSDYVQFLGAGAERVEEELHRHFPNARIGRLDRDTVSSKGSFEQILHSFREHELDVLVGTQMIAKGHDIPNVTLVGIVLADIGLSMPDFRAAERSFQLLTQAAGRAGRGSISGHVIIQTLNPEHYAIRLAADQNYEAFYQKEIEFRKWLRYPPFATLANLVIRDEKQEQALRMATEIAHILTPPPEGVRMMGPAEAPILRVKNEYRYQILIKALHRDKLRRLLQSVRAMAEEAKWKATALIVDMDPISLM